LKAEKAEKAEKGMKAVLQKKLSSMGRKIQFQQIFTY
jgi:hypothetical protein